MSYVDQKALQALHPRLARIVEQEIASGNEIASAGMWLYEFVEVLVCLKSKIRKSTEIGGFEIAKVSDRLISDPPKVDISFSVEVPDGKNADSRYFHVLRVPEGNGICS